MMISSKTREINFTKCNWILPPPDYNVHTNCWIASEYSAAFERVQLYDINWMTSIKNDQTEQITYLDLSLSRSLSLFFFFFPGRVNPLHSGEIWNKKWENWSPGNGGGWFDLSSYSLWHYHQAAGSHTGLCHSKPMMSSADCCQLRLNSFNCSSRRKN